MGVIEAEVWGRQGLAEHLFGSLVRSMAAALPFVLFAYMIRGSLEWLFRASPLNRLAFVAVVVDVTDYMDVYGLVNIWTDFNNDAFATNPTIPAPDQGLGAAVRVMPTENFYILGGIADANGDHISEKRTS